MAPESPPTPLFILQNSKQITSVLFSRLSDPPHLFSGSRDGDVVIYNCKHRRPVFSSNVNNKQAILTIVELDESNFLTHTRNGCIFKWTGQDLSSPTFKCKSTLNKQPFILLGLNLIFKTTITVYL